ncbi:hypothetical protein JKG47_08330 [Acidithiobacillus sp. MC6.1]|nr:hypothetical protein [Acidithiobacillus sp. MC6.1]
MTPAEMMDLLGMDRLIRRSFESATVAPKHQKTLKAWHDVEVLAAYIAQRRNMSTEARRFTRL